MEMISHLSSKWRQAVFGTDLTGRGWPETTAVFLARLLYGIVLKFQDKRLHVQSTSLAYTTILSLVPLLAVTFSVLKGFGVQNQLEPMLMQSLGPLGEKGIEIGQNILAFVNNLNFAVLGFLGIALLFWTVISLLQKVEEAFNAIWHVPHVRRLSRRFSDYLSVTLVGPVFIITALGVTTIVLRNETVQQLAAVEPFGWVILGIGRFMPYLLICAAFAFVYAFLTNTYVRVVPALAGGVFTSMAWYGVGMLFAHFVANSTKYTAIYTGFAAAVLFIIWVNVGWLIVLVGAHVTRYWQNPHLLERLNAAAVSKRRHAEAYALEIMTLIGRAYYFGGPRWTLEALAAQGGGASSRQLEDLVQALEDRRLIVATHDEPTSYVPGRAIETIHLRDIAAAAVAREAPGVGLPAVQQVIDQIDRAVAESLEGQTLRDLVLADERWPTAVAVGPDESKPS